MIADMLRTLLKLVAAFALLLAALVGWIGYRGHDAKTRVQAFCKATSVGQASAGLVEKARAAGLEAHEIPEDGSADPSARVLLCSDGVMLARHICEIHYSGQRVTAARVGFID
jgi:hypothetical protein